MSYNNPGNISSSGSPQSVATPAVAITAISTGQIIPPMGYTFGWALVSNASPWIMTLATSEGTKTLLPYEEDVCIPTSAGFSYQMSIAPGGSAAAPANSIACYQIDWFVAGGAPPPGVFPVSLTAAALSSVVIGGVGSSTIATITPATMLPQTYPVPAWAQSLEILYEAVPTGLTLTGSTTGFIYFNEQMFNTAEKPMPGSPIAVFVNATLDTSILVTSGAIAGTVFITASAQQALANPSTQPLFVSETDRSPITASTQGSAIANASNTVVLAAPSTGYVWEVSLLSIINTTAGAGTASLTGTTTGVPLLVAATLTAPSVAPSNLFLSEGVTMHNPAAVNATGTVWARQIHLAGYSY